MSEILENQLVNETVATEPDQPQNDAAPTRLDAVASDIGATNAAQVARHNLVRKPQPKRRTAIADLPPDRQAEIAGRRLAGAAKRKQAYRPQIPEIAQDIEIHTYEVGVIFTRDFEACNQYAVAIDYVARERLTSRQEYNAYLQEFQDALDELTRTLAELHAHYEVVSNGGKAKSRKPRKVEVGIQSNRSMQLLELFRTADEILRMVQFVAIFGDLDADDARKATDQVQRSLGRCVKALRNVKIRCFKRIVELENLRMPVRGETSIEELEGARRVAAIKSGMERAKAKAVPSSDDRLLDPNAAVDGANPQDESKS